MLFEVNSTDDTVTCPTQCNNAAHLNDRHNNQTTGNSKNAGRRETASKRACPDRRSPIALGPQLRLQDDQKSFG